MSAAELRKAAETLRGLAAEALPAPWSVRNDSESLHDVQSESCGHASALANHTSEDECDEWGIAVAAANLRTGACMLGDARYIATMHPGVGLALADLLLTSSEGACCDECIADPGADPLRASALAVARLINGGAA